jgi:hypothetical protein
VTPIEVWMAVSDKSRVSLDLASAAPIGRTWQPDRNYLLNHSTDRVENSLSVHYAIFGPKLTEN